MTDRLQTFAHHWLTAPVVKLLGLPRPPFLGRTAGPFAAQALSGRKALLLQGAKGYAAETLRQILAGAGATILSPADGGAPDIVVLDASGCMNAQACRDAYALLHPVIGSLASNARVLLVGAPPAQAPSAAAAGALEGFTRSLAKEVGRYGATANLVQVAPDALARMDWIVRFFCGHHSTYISGQVLRPHALARVPAAQPQAATLAGKVALVTGSARGIGRATAVRLAQEGATVICADLAAAGAELDALCTQIGGVALQLDIAAPDTPAQVQQFCQSRFGGLDIVVHNAGITRDRTLARMSASEWDAVMAVNLEAVLRLTDALLQHGTLRDEGRIVCLSSTSAIAGNFGQTNYACAKSAIIAWVAASAAALAARGITINALAPGFIDTAMTRKMPFTTREAGRRLNALRQAGLPEDVANAVAFLSAPGASSLSGAVLRVCGQSIVGA
ncbi:3-oxoacyl-ACP reductase [Massilia sp. CF038]|uniref:3-oxoacyl-ACP reductase n=1 Tax=Massilia sp. CF038 TaxID=1881045 RepID=UPI00091990C2|nr:3-oxoacyl-ACP reductase [Massilia sp. CF038]SHG73734.1 3-oxoacyl-[acyl-carrier protein] reductase [Massilia sp. CF038]